MCLFQETCLQAHIKKLTDSYWTVRVQTQVYTLITNARAAQRELADVTEAESHQNWSKWGYIWVTRPFP